MLQRTRVDARSQAGAWSGSALEAWSRREGDEAPHVNKLRLSTSSHVGNGSQWHAAGTFDYMYICMYSCPALPYITGLRVWAFATWDTSALTVKGQF